VDPSQDPIVKQLREKVSDVDRGLVEAINARLRLVAQLKSYKDSRGYDFVDPEREEWMMRDVSRSNRGPLSQEGLEGIYQAILDLSKREVS
jgi:chorismate mutase / prephenate dehydratase